jgi:uncharacterized membrane protein YuzA (DUF378 family)
MGKISPRTLYTNWTHEKEILMKKLDAVAGVLVIVGALNWGLVAIAEFDLVAAIFGLDFGETNAVTRIVYGLVGLSGVWLATRVPALAGHTTHRDRVAA